MADRLLPYIPERIKHKKKKKKINLKYVKNAKTILFLDGDAKWTVFCKVENHNVFGLSI